MSEVKSEPKVGCCWFKKKNKKQEEPPATCYDRVPYSARLPKDLGIGKAICVIGAIQPKCLRFAVNLKCGPHPEADVAFHVNPRISAHSVVRNSRINGRWGEEETVLPVKFSFARKKRFNLAIFIAKEEFMVSLDGVHLFSYRFRVPLVRVTDLEVQGLVDVLGVEYPKLDIYPERNDYPAIRTGTRKEGTSPKDLPVTFLLPGGFQLDWQIELYGRVKILPSSFHLSLQEGAHRWPEPNIPLYLSISYHINATGDALIVRNARYNGTWGQEERTPGLRFVADSPFTMALRRNKDYFSIWTDGKLCGEFKFRGAVDKIDTVLIQGDLNLYDIVLNQQ